MSCAETAEVQSYLPGGANVTTWEGTLASPGEYEWTVRLRRRYGQITLTTCYDNYVHITQPDAKMYVTATFRSAAANFIRHVVTWRWRWWKHVRQESLFIALMLCLPLARWFYNFQCCGSRVGFKFSVCFAPTLNGLLAFVIEPNSIVLYRLGFAFEDTAVCHTTTQRESVK